MHTFLTAAFVLFLSASAAVASPYACDQVTVSRGSGAAYARAAVADIQIVPATATVVISGVTYTLNRAVTLPGYPQAYVLGSITLANIDFFGTAPRVEISIGSDASPSQNPAGATAALHYLCWP